MTQSDGKSRSANEIDNNLRRAFDEISNQELPDRFSKLLASLKEAETRQDQEQVNDE